MSQPRRLHPLRTAQDFDNHFQEPDPWRVKGNNFYKLRNRLVYEEFRNCLRLMKDRAKVLELG